MNSLRTFLLLVLTTPFFNNGTTTISADFTSGSIGEVIQNPYDNYHLVLRNDNDNAHLPNKWRSWWFVKVHDPFNSQKKIHVNIVNRGWNDFSMPAYSYDNKTWHRVDDKTASQSAACRQGIKNCVLSFTQTLKDNTVYLASFIPYTITQLEQYLDKIATHPAVAIDILGYSSHYQLPIYHLEITDNNSTKQTHRVWIHARTHPGETPGNFILEGLIDFLLSEDSAAKAMREEVIFHIVPMHNPDGVVAGNYRSTTNSINLEPFWFFDKKNPATLRSYAPKENRLLNAKMKSLLSNKIPVTIALNLHASHSEPETAVFSFPHFGDDVLKYAPEQVDLWQKQLRFMDHLAKFYDHRVELPPPEGYNTFLEDFYPETWWWYNKQNQVMAMTLEATYGKAGFDHWVTDKEHRDLGKALAKTFATYLSLTAAPILPEQKDPRIWHHSIIYNPGFEKITKEVAE